MKQCSTKRWYILSVLFYFKMLIILFWATTTTTKKKHQKKCFSVIIKPHYCSWSYQCLVKNCILSQSIPWCFPGPPLPQTVQLVLLTKANVKENLVFFCVHLLFNQCCVPVFGKRLNLTEQEHTYSMNPSASTLCWKEKKKGK